MCTMVIYEERDLKSYAHVHCVIVAKTGEAHFTRFLVLNPTVTMCHLHFLCCLHFCLFSYFLLKFQGVIAL